MDSCNPFAKLKLQSYRIYSILIPLVCMALVLEGIFVFMSIPATLGSALTISGPFPKAATSALLEKK